MLKLISDLVQMALKETGRRSGSGVVCSQKVRIRSIFQPLEASKRMRQRALEIDSRPVSQTETESDASVESSDLMTLEEEAGPRGLARPTDQTPEEKAEEARLIRRMQLMMSMVMQVIQQDHSLPVEQASAMVVDARRAALAMFPDKETAFDLIFWPRLQRLMRERYRMQ